jgi:hypothetical protein
MRHITRRALLKASAGLPLMPLATVSVPAFMALRPADADEERFVFIDGWILKADDVEERLR